jgi:hypothetical protein
MITEFQQYQVAALIYNLVFLGYFGTVFSSKDGLNRFIKLLTLVIFVVGTIFAIGMIRNGIHFNIITHTVCVYAAAVGTLFLFAKDSNWRATITKMCCLASVVATIIYFYL